MPTQENGLGQVLNRLAVGTDEVDLVDGSAGPAGNFEGRVGNEDQQLGHRLFQKLGLEWVFIYEPPFAWHPTSVADVPKPPPPPEFDLGAALASRDPIQPFDPARVQLA